MALTFVGRASATTVAVVRPEDPSPIIAETLVRLEGELRSVGFETAILDVPREAEARKAEIGLDAIGSRWRVDAVVALLGDVASARVDIWVIDRSTGRTLDRTASLEPGIEPSSRTLAIRALELLRSSLLELDLSLPVETPRAPDAPTVIAPVQVGAGPGSRPRDSSARRPRDRGCGRGQHRRRAERRSHRSYASTGRRSRSGRRPCRQRAWAASPRCDRERAAPR